MIVLERVLSGWFKVAETGKHEPDIGNGILHQRENKLKWTFIVAPEKMVLKVDHDFKIWPFLNILVIESGLFIWWFSSGFRLANASKMKIHGFWHPAKSLLEDCNDARWFVVLACWPLAIHYCRQASATGKRQNDSGGIFIPVYNSCNPLTTSDLTTWYIIRDLYLNNQKAFWYR